VELLNEKDTLKQLLGS